MAGRRGGHDGRQKWVRIVGVCFVFYDGHGAWNTGRAVQTTFTLAAGHVQDITCCRSGRMIVQ